MTLPGQPVERSGAMEGALETLAADRSIVQARFPRHLGRRRAPPTSKGGGVSTAIRSEGPGGRRVGRLSM